MPFCSNTVALGERILNHLVILLRDDYRNTDEYKKVHSKDSFDNWNLAIEVLERWNVLLPDVAREFRRLREIRTGAIHFRPELDTNDRSMALQASNCLLAIISGQFGADGTKPWFMTNTPGELFIKKEAESTPFVRRVYLPNCGYVGPYHKMERHPDGWRVIDNSEYEAKEITDEQFKELRKNAK